MMVDLQVCATVEKEQCEKIQERKLETKCTIVDTEKCRQARAFSLSLFPLEQFGSFSLSPDSSQTIHFQSYNTEKCNTSFSLSRLP